jgi:hypothetical protein
MNGVDGHWTSSIKRWPNYTFSPLTYFMVSFWSLNYLLFYFGPLTLFSLVILVLWISFQILNIGYERHTVYLQHLIISLLFKKNSPFPAHYSTITKFLLLFLRTNILKMSIHKITIIMYKEIERKLEREKQVRQELKWT